MTRIWQETLQRAKVLQAIIAMYKESCCNRNLKQTAISLTTFEAEFHAALLAELLKEPHYKVLVRLEIGSDSARQELQRRGPGGLKHMENQVGRVDAISNTANLFTKILE